MVTQSVYSVIEDRSAVSDITGKLNHLGDLINGLDKISGSLTNGQLGWLKDLKNAFDLINKTIGKQINNLSQLRTKLIARIDLLTDVAEVITADATELVDSQQQAHVIVGFSVTRALVKAADPFESVDNLKKASEDLKAALEKARAVPKQDENSVRTHYNLERLVRAITRAKDLRNREFRNKLNPAELAKIDLLIRKADDVKADRTATVGEVKEMTAKLNDAVDQAYLSIPEEERTANDAARYPLKTNIDAAKILRDFRLKGKVDNMVIRELDRVIANSERVLRNSRATVREVNGANEILLKEMQRAEGLVVDNNANLEAAY